MPATYDCTMKNNITLDQKTIIIQDYDLYRNKQNLTEKKRQEANSPLTQRTSLDDTHH